MGEMKNILPLVLLLSIAATPAPTSQPATQPSVTYHHRTVPPQWVNEQYLYFKDKITYVNGKFTDVGKEYLEKWPAMERGFTQPAAGQLRFSNITAPTGQLRTKCTVIKLVEGETAIIERRFLQQPKDIEKIPDMHGGYPSFYFRLSGKKLKVGDTFNGPMTYIGNAPTDGQDMQWYWMPESLTKDEFIQCLNGGFELKRFRYGKILQGGASIGTARNGNSVVLQGRTSEVDGIQETPVP